MCVVKPSWQVNSRASVPVRGPTVECGWELPCSNRAGHCQWGCFVSLSFPQWKSADSQAELRVTEFSAAFRSETRGKRCVNVGIFLVSILNLWLWTDLMCDNAHDTRKQEKSEGWSWLNQCRSLFIHCYTIRIDDLKCLKRFWCSSVMIYKHKSKNTADFQTPWGLFETR